MRLAGISSSTRRSSTISPPSVTWRLAEERSANRGLLMVDSPRFDNRSTPPAAVLRGAEPECDGLAWLHFDPLPASTREAESIVRIWRSSDGDTQRLSGRAATEAALKQRAAGNRVLHLATHAFFQRDQSENTSKGAAVPRQRYRRAAVAAGRPRLQRCQQSTGGAARRGGRHSDRRRSRRPRLAWAGMGCALRLRHRRR